ncbi:MAG: putative quinol monooxygenase [Bradyrhizobium sp.]
MNRAIILAVLGLCLCTPILAGDMKPQVVQLAKLEIDPAQLESYKTALKEEVETALRVEPGVLRLDAMAEKQNPTHVTLLQVYADNDAYEAHLQSAHFLKYKTGTKEMVKSLQLVRMVPLFTELKQK